MHHPSPIALLTPLPISRTASPALNYSPSTASKCERLLRDTLRRADLASSSSRTASPCTPYFPHEVFIADCLTRDADDNDDDDDLFAPAMTSQLRRASTTAHPPSPTRPQVQHSPRTTHGHAHHRASHSMSAAAPPVLRHPTPLRPGVSASRSDPSHRSTTPSAAPLLPHEVALRSRLQGVLDSHARSGSAGGHRRATGPIHPPPGSSRNHNRSRSVSARTQAYDGDAAWWSSTTPASPVTEATPSLSHHSSIASLSSVPSSRSDSHPSTPPSPTTDRPSFDVRTASAFCRNNPGLVSFRDVEGLGAPPDADEEDSDAEEERRGRWWDLYSWSPFKGRRRPSAPESSSA
ncbi:hypothetical protein EXIGLDRAFT_782411 [Exidia glandulosa HHB12029]|uniref:Uncharacterized protein n=1 Tax=Exidia glandulosa HHB12029 TaxID=1314781 RepID=A0A165Z507_EXIGL|nr:hypothetical protein EXIGLDRAFT_782411 [Exidia glandulosa HHB12029]